MNDPVEHPGALSMAFWTGGAPVWAGQLTPECARDLAGWFRGRASAEGTEDGAGELRQVASRLESWADRRDGPAYDEVA